MQMLVGIFNGIFLNPVNLQNITKDNIMIGIAIVGRNPMKSGATKGKIRKLSVTLSLSEARKDYTGGELEFDFRNADPDKNLIYVNVKKFYPKDLW